MNRKRTDSKHEPGVQSESVLLVQEPAKLGKFLRAIRKDQINRIDDAAALLGVSVDLMSRLENGASSIRLDKLLAVLDGLGLALVVGPKDQVSDFVTEQELRRAERD